MAIFPRPSRPSAVWTDFKAFLRQQGRPKFGLMALSMVIPLLIVAGFYHDSTMDRRAAQIVYVQTLDPNRTDEEIMKQNIEDQKKLDAERAETQRSYQRLADKLGIEYEGKK